MTKGISEKEPDPRIVYADVIDLPHWQSPTHPHMSLYDRSAQFAPFAALVGYDDMVQEEARMTDAAVELEEYELENLNQKLSLIADVIEDGHHPTLTFTVFVPDEHKAGGKYVEITDAIKRIESTERRVVLMTTEGYGHLNRTIDFDKIISIRGDLVDYLDD